MKYLYSLISTLILRRLAFAVLGAVCGALLVPALRVRLARPLPHRYTAEEVGVWDALIDVLMADQEQDA